MRSRTWLGRGMREPLRDDRPMRVLSLPLSWLLGNLLLVERILGSRKRGWSRHQPTPYTRVRTLDRVLSSSRISGSHLSALSLFSCLVSVGLSNKASKPQVCQLPSSQDVRSRSGERGLLALLRFSSRSRSG